MKIAFSPPEEAGSSAERPQKFQWEPKNPNLSCLGAFNIKNAKFGFIKGRKREEIKNPKCPEPECDIRSLEATFIMFLMWFPSSPLACSLQQIGFG